jgi:hypothetical protein
MRAASRDLLFICLNTFVVVVSTHKQCNVKPLPSFISIVFNLPKFIVSLDILIIVEESTVEPDYEIPNIILLVYPG